MAGYKVIEEQEKVLNLKGKNIIVSASAGSGKTSVMIRKILSHIMSHDSDYHAGIDRMLVLTYTRSAAEEMRQRLEKEITSNISSDKNMSVQLDKLRTADISTIHSFCQKMIKKYFYTIDIDPNFNIAEENLANELKQKCLKIIIEDFKLAKPDDYMSLIDAFSTTRSERELSEIIFSLFDFVSSQPDEKWLENISAKLYKEQGTTFSIAKDIITQEYISFKNSFIKIMKQAEELEESKLKTHLLQFYNDIINIETKKDFISLYDYLSEKPSFSNIPKSEAVDFKKEVASICDNYKSFRRKSIAKLDFGDHETIKESFEFGKTILSSLIEILNGFKNEYYRQKTYKNIFDFSDLEHEFLKILEDETIVAELKSKYKYIFIDEYQDANAVQEKIISSLSSDNNRTMVGDVKQSIYGFRLSNPKIFLSIQDDYNKRVDSESCFLNTNFRSSGKILKFVNMIFSKIMTTQTSGIDYNKTSMMKPYDLSEEYPGCGVELILLEKPNEVKGETLSSTKVYSVKADMQQTKDIEEKELMHAQSRMVAQKILQLKQQKIFDKSLNVERDTNFKDITILIRARTSMDTLISELVQCGVPVLASSNSNLLNFPEIREIIAFLKALTNWEDDYALCSGLLSYWGKLSNADLACIKLEYPNEKKFVDAVNKYSENKNDILSKKIKNFIVLKNNLIKEVALNGASKTIEHFVLDSGYTEWLLPLNDGDAKVWRIQTLITNILGLSDKSLYEITAYLSDEMTSINSPSISSGEDDFVSITTIHGSKGLEYPICILFDASANILAKGKQNSKKLEADNDLGLAIKSYDLENKIERNSLPYYVISQKGKKEDFAELLRLLYVALTRAKNKLIISGIIDKNKISKIDNEYDLYSSGDYLNIILGCLSENNIDKISLKKDCLISQEDGEFLLEFYQYNNERIIKNEKYSTTFSSPNEELKEKISQIINYKYPDVEKTKISIKNSVTALSSEGQDNYFSSLNDEPRTFKLEEHKTTMKKNDLGTLYHRVLEYACFDKITSIKDVSILLNELINSNKISPSESELIDENKVLNAINKTGHLIGKNSSVYKEQQFMMRIKHAEIVDSGEDVDILVQGKIDLLIVGDKNIIIDYKLSNKSSEELIATYSKQLKLYSLATSKVLNKTINDIYIFEINRSEFIKI